MPQETLATSQDRLTQIQRKVRVTQGLTLLCLLGLVFESWALTRPNPSFAQQQDKVLRARGIIIEDAMGRPRILLGAPIAKVEGRKDQEDVYGLIVVGENGVDRVMVCYPLPGTQREGEAAGGVLMNDARGGERGGYVAADNGEVVLTLDGTKDEAIKLGVDPTKPISWIALNDFEDIRPRMLMALRGRRPARVMILNPTGPDEQEIRVLGLSERNGLRLTLPRAAGRTAILDAVDKLDP
jgi:hypothetical protein